MNVEDSGGKVQEIYWFKRTAVCLCLLPSRLFSMLVLRLVTSEPFGY